MDSFKQWYYAMLRSHPGAALLVSLKHDLETLRPCFASNDEGNANAAHCPENGCPQCDRFRAMQRLIRESVERWAASQSSHRTEEPAGSAQTTTAGKPPAETPATPSLEAPESVISSIINELPETYLCRGPRIVVKNESLSQVKLLGDLVAYYLNKEDRGRFSSPIGDSPDPKLAEYYCDYINNRRAKDRYLKGSRPMCWVTQSRLLDEVVSDESDGRPGSGADDEPNKSVADKVRTQLGLIHFTGPDLVVELRYSSSQVESADLSAPTFMDGCPSDFYLSSDRSDGWGRAICLDTVEVGLPEAVHRQILFDGTFEIRPIGYLAFENDSEQARGRFREKHNAEWEDDTLQAIWQLLTN